MICAKECLKTCGSQGKVFIQTTEPASVRSTSAKPEYSNQRRLECVECGEANKTILYVVQTNVTS